MEDQLGFLEFQTILLKVMSEGMSYFGEGSILHLNVSEGGKKVVLQLESVFKNKPSIESALLKLAHDASMMNGFVNSVFSQISDFNYFTQHKLDINKNFYLKIKILTEDVNILERKGFGLFMYDESDMAKVLNCFKLGYLNLFEDYIDELRRVNNFESANDIERIYRFIEEDYHEQDINKSMFDFIQLNFDMYAKYL